MNLLPTAGLTAGPPSSPQAFPPVKKRKGQTGEGGVGRLGAAQSYWGKHLASLLWQSWKERQGPRREGGISCPGIKGPCRGRRLTFLCPIGAWLSQRSC